MSGKLRLRHVWVLLVVCGAFIGPASSPVTAPDAFWSLRRGAWMTEQRALLTHDPFTTAPRVAEQVVNVQWLADLVLYGLHSAGGLELVILGTAEAVVVAYTLVFGAAVGASGSLRLSCLALAAAYLLGSSNLSPRPQTLAYPLFGIFVLALARAEWRKDTRLLWLLPVASAVWANVHGSFFVGPLLVACYAAGQLSRRYTLILVGCLVAMAATPYGVASIGYVVALSTNPIVREQVPEWSPTTVTSLEGGLLFAALAALCGLALKARTRLTRAEVLALLVFGALALASVRGVVWFGLAVAPIAARLMASLPLPDVRHRREQPLLNLAIAASLAVVAGLSLPWTKHLAPILPDTKRGVLSVETPTSVATFLTEWDPPAAGRMFNYERWGGYFDWAIWPRHKPFLDGRFELHPPRVWLDYLAVVFPTTRWRSLLDEYDITYLVLSQSEQPELIQLLRQEPDWAIEYEDWQAAVLARRPAGASRPRRSRNDARRRSAPELP